MMLHILILCFAAIFVLAGVALAVVDMFGRIDYLKEKFPWLGNVLEKKGTAAVLFLTAIFLLFGDGYELLVKEMPPIPEAPKMTIMVPAPPTIATTKVVTVQGACKLTPEQLTLAHQAPCPQQSGIATTYLDRMRTTNAHLTDADRGRLSQALFEFAAILDQANTVWGKANNVDTDLSKSDFAMRKTRLQALLPLAKDYEHAFYQARQKWNYFGDQTNYIFGDDPDNDAALVENAASAYLSFLDSLQTLQGSTETPGLNILSTEQNDYRTTINKFENWTSDCRTHLQQMRDSIK
jgi:hypothetical protein